MSEKIFYRQEHALSSCFPGFHGVHGAIFSDSSVTGKKSCETRDASGISADHCRGTGRRMIQDSQETYPQFVHFSSPNNAQQGPFIHNASRRKTVRAGPLLSFVLQGADRCHLGQAPKTDYAENCINIRKMRTFDAIFWLSAKESTTRTGSGQVLWITLWTMWISSVISRLFKGKSAKNDVDNPVETVDVFP